MDPVDNHLHVELDEIHTRYRKRTQRGTSAWKLRYYQRMRAERDAEFHRVLHERFSDVSALSCLEIGAGRGENLPFFHNIGIPWEQIHANELLEDRVVELRSSFPDVTIIPGNALDISGGNYDVVLVSAVFSSILDLEFRKDLANHLLDILSTGGCILWHDFCYQNPFNRDVSGIKDTQLRQLFSASGSIRMQPITLTPPVAMLVGPLYSWFAWVPALKSHLLAVIDKP